MSPNFEIKPYTYDYGKKAYWIPGLRSIGLSPKYSTSKAKLQRWLADNMTNLGAAIEPREQAQLADCVVEAKRLGVDIREALRFWDQHAKRLKPKDVGEAVDECLEAKETANCRTSTLYHLKSTLDRFSSHFRGREAHTITLAEIKAWAGSFEWAPYTRSRMMMNVDTFFSFCLKHHYATANPMDALEAYKVDLNPPKVLPVEDVATLLKRTYEFDRDMLTFAVLQTFGALRNSEATCVAVGGLKAFLKNDGAEIDLWGAHTKGRNRRVVPVNPLDLHGKPFSPLAAWLKLDTGNMVKSATIVIKRWAAVRYLEDGKPVVPWSNDCLRHTASSMLYMAVGPERESVYSGHSMAVAESNYRGRYEQADMVKFWALTPEAVL